MNKVMLKNVIKRIKDKVDKDKTDLKYYVGGEHFDSSNVQISRKGLIKGSTIGPAFHMRFQQGDVLLMSRNPHLRKAAMVDFEGICSDVSYVCRTKDENVLLQKFIPFIFQTDNFWEFAEGNKKGSTNFFLNWSDFEKFEFTLPSIEEQRKLCDLLWSLQNTKNAYLKLSLKTDELVKSKFSEMFGDPIENDKGWKTRKLSEVAPINNAVIPDQEEYWWLNLDMIESYSGNLIDKVIVSVDNIGSSTYPFDENMVLYSKLRPYLNKVFLPDDFGYATTELVGFNPDKKVLSRSFLFNLLRSDYFVDYSIKSSSGSQMPRMPMKLLRNFECILPPIELQNKFSEISEQADKSKKEIEQAISDMDNLIRAFMLKNSNKEE